MNCSEVQERLSEYHDGELSKVDVSLVAAHLAHCSSCAAELASFEQLSGLSRKLTDPPIPAHMWEELQAKLPVAQERNQIPVWLNSKRTAAKLLALAATILVALGIGVAAQRSWFAIGGHDHLADDFGTFLEEFEDRPDDAQQILLTNYEGRSTTLREAASMLGYEPAVAIGLPAGCSLQQVYLLKMPCCTCTQVVCRNKDGQSIAIFEHNADQPAWFGNRPTVNCICHEVPTSIVQVGNKLAATWKEGPRFITIIGANDLEEVADFVAHFAGEDSGRG